MYIWHIYIYIYVCMYQCILCLYIFVKSKLEVSSGLASLLCLCSTSLFFTATFSLLRWCRFAPLDESNSWWQHIPMAIAMFDASNCPYFNASNIGIKKKQETDGYNPPFPSQLCPSAAPPAEPLGQWAACARPGWQAGASRYRWHEPHPWEYVAAWHWVNPT